MAENNNTTQTEQLTKKDMRNGCLILVIIAVIIAALLQSCFGGSDEEEYEPSVPVFGQPQIINVLNNAATAAVVPTNREYLTDSALIGFFNFFVYESGHNWVTLDFGDGTGYQFRAAGNRFSYIELAEEGRSGRYLGTSGYINDNQIRRINYEPDSFAEALQPPEPGYASAQTVESPQQENTSYDKSLLINGLYFEFLEAFAVEVITEITQYHLQEDLRESPEVLYMAEYHMNEPVLFIPLMITTVETQEIESEYRHRAGMRARTHTGRLSIFEADTLNGRRLIQATPLGTFDEVPNREGAVTHGYLAFLWQGYGEYTVEFMSGFGGEIYTTIVFYVAPTLASQPTPTATPEPSPSPTPSPTPEPAPEATPEPAPEPVHTLTIVSAPNEVRRNEHVTITISGRPNSQYRLRVRYADWSTAAGLGYTTTDSNGNASWTWQIGGNTGARNNALAEIQGGGVTLNHYFAVIVD
jgi:hypothetical protein